MAVKVVFWESQMKQISIKEISKPWRSFCTDMIQSRQNVNIVISCPKSGRTWHRASLGLYVSQAYGLDARHCLDTRFITRAAGLPCTSYSHNGANFTHCVKARHFLTANSLLWRGKNIVLLVREPSAIAVSSFHHFSSRSKKFNGTLSEFIRNPQTGIEKILVAYNRWHEHCRKSEKFMVQSYEGMHADSRAALLNALQFIGVTEVKEDALKYALNLTTFENLKKLEQEEFFKHNSLKPHLTEPNGEKVRQGTVDGYQKSLSPEDLDFIQTAINRIGNPFETAIRQKSVGVCDI